MRQEQAILEMLDDERRRLVRMGEALEIVPPVVRWRSDDHSHHSIIHSSLDSANADAVIEREIAHYRRLGAGFEWKLYAHDPPADLLDRLRCRGFVVGPQEAVMVFDLSQRAGWIEEEASSSCRVVRVDREEDVEIYRRLAEAITGKNYAFTAGELANAIRAGSTDHRGYVAYTGEEPVSIGRLYSHPQSRFGGLYGGATLPEYRGRGLYRAVVAARARDARKAGASYLIVDALPTSRPILERLGFVRVTETWPCDWAPSGEDVLPPRR